MSRKAVQGYSEKSYYDNTRFNGVTATTDPLNEGYFNQLINVDISDTGQSLTPRKGFLTTTISHEGTAITLSDHTIVFRDQGSQHDVIYDLTYNTGYIADIHAYNLDDVKYIPTIRAITTIDWTSVVTFLINHVASVKAEYDEILQGLSDPAVYAYVETDVNAYNAAMYQANIANFQTPTAELIDELYALENIEGLVIRYNQTEVYTYWICTRLTRPVSQAYPIMVTYILQRISLLTDTRVEMIRDLALIEKAVLKVRYNDELNIMLELYYRETGNSFYAANTLVIGVMNTFDHPTYDPTQRSIAVSSSIIPDVMQNLYTTETRPTGFISELGPFLYYSNADDEYMTAFVYRTVHYDITPYFDLNPAYMETGTTSGNSDKWAYRFDVVSTRPLDVTNPNQEIIFRGPWTTYNGTDTAPTLVRSLASTVVLTESDRSLNHIKDTRHVIHVVPKTPVATTSTRTYTTITPPVYSASDMYTNYPTMHVDVQAAYARHATWSALINGVNSTSTLRSAINALAETALFYVYDLDNAPKDADETYGDFEQSLIGTTNSVEDNLGLHTTHDGYFMTGSELLDYITDRAVFKNGEYVTFHLLPFASRDTISNTYNTDGWITYRYWYSTINGWDSGYEAYSCKYNLYEYSQHLFYREDAGVYTVGTSTTSLKTANTLPAFNAQGFFDKGYHVIFYMRPYESSDVTGLTCAEWLLLSSSWAASTPYINGNQTMVYGYDDITVSTIPLTLDVPPQDIHDADKFIVFDGNRLVTWARNTLYISEPGNYYYFKQDGVREFGERIIKVLQFKTILLVFTTQHLYAVYQIELENISTDAEGKQQTTISVHWAHQIVLYNILTSEKYTDVIQVFNQMILFYSEDGQLFMIKPNTMIDSETRFTLQYFNKSANDILLNYDKYINERLATYLVDTRVTKDMVQIKALLSINTLKIIYYVPDLITYILNYDVINNRYTVYDTLSFSHVKDKRFVESGELYLTTQTSKLFFTFPYVEPNSQDNYNDMAFLNNFQKVGINTLLDTGTLNLNNHIMKRFLDLHVTFKNLSSSRVLFNVEVSLDDMVHRPYYDTTLEVKELNGMSYYVTVPKANTNDILDLVNSYSLSQAASNAFLYALSNNLFEENNVLMNFGDYTSSKLLTHRSDISGMGKVIRLRLQFISKGCYKIQNFGIVFKERRL